jgi:three-Cys-motif partner protein
LNALRRAKQTWKGNGRDVKMTALLVEKHPKAYAQLATVSKKYPDIEIKTYNADVLEIVPSIMKDIPARAFAFFLLDPKGWAIPLAKLKDMLARQNSEMTFNFMFDFINRAASMSDPLIVKGLDDLIPYGNWRQQMKDAERRHGRALKPEERSTILIGAFKQSLRELGGYTYVAETPVQRPLRDRPLYYLFYATRHKRGLEVFRDCQVKALIAQSATRAASKVRQATAKGQSEFFDSMHEMGPDETGGLLDRAKRDADATVLELIPDPPASVLYGDIWPAVLALHVVKLTDVNKICANLRKEGKIEFPNWEKGKHVPKDNYRAVKVKA